MIIFALVMQREIRILRFKWPDRTEFTEEEVREARRVLYRDEGKDESACRLPVRFVPVGGTCEFKGRTYRCVPASRDILTDPCLGCDIGGENCTSKAPQCSPFDRRDRRRVWFKLLDETVSGDGKA